MTAPLRRTLARAVLVAFLIGAGLALAGWVEATRVPVVVAYDVAVPDWPVGAPPLRIVQLSDTHAGPPDMPLARLAAIVAQANGLHPDIVLLTGDYNGGKLFDPDPGNLDDVVRPFAKLRSRLGTFAVRGNHDDPFWSPRVIPRYRMTYLQNSWADAGPVIVAGLDDRITGHPDVSAALRGIPAGKPVIMLMHEGDDFVSVPHRVALTLSGHTHGGQIVVPGIGAPWIGTAFLRAHRRAIFVEGGRVLVTSSGVGTTGVPIRLGVPPEIVLVTLHR